MGEFDISLINEFRIRPSFYDRNSPRFKDKLYNAHQWQEISNKLGFDVSILKDRILQLRNRYNLEKRRIEQLREENPNKFYDSPWPLYDHLHFLSDHIRARRSYKKMMPLNGVAGGVPFVAIPPEFSNSCSNNSNLTSHHNTNSGAAAAGDVESSSSQNMAAFPNGLLAVKMEDESDETEQETESQNNDSEINAFDATGLIPGKHSSPLPTQYLQQQQQQHYVNKTQQKLKKQQQQKNSSISIRHMDSLRQDYAADSSTSNYNRQLLQQQQQQQHQQQQNFHHTSSSLNQSALQNNYVSAASDAPPPMQTRFNARELKYAAFGNFISSSLSNLPPSIALDLVEKFTSDIVKVLMENAQQQQQLLQQQLQMQQEQQQQQLLQQQQQQQQPQCNDSEN